MKPARHPAISTFIAGGSYLATGSPSVAVATLVIGTIIDGDHLFDYGYYLSAKKGGSRRPQMGKLLDSSYMEETGKAFVPLNSYELLLPLWGICLAFFSASIAFWLSVSFVVHLVIDLLYYRLNPFSYFFTF